MSIAYRICIILLILATGYTAYWVVHFKRANHAIYNPSAEFQVTGNQESNLTLVEFVSHDCGYCKELEPVMTELLEVRSDIRYVIRPVAFSDWNEETDTEIPNTITKKVFAAGLQDKFLEMHRAVLEYPATPIPEDFIRETANLYGIDYDQMIVDADSAAVQEIIDENFEALAYAGLNSVPSFMINGKSYIVSDGNLPDLKTMLDLIVIAERP